MLRAMKIILITPASPQSRNGNRTTAMRFHAARANGQKSSGNTPVATVSGASFSRVIL